MGFTFWVCALWCLCSLRYYPRISIIVVLTYLKSMIIFMSCYPFMGDNGVCGYWFLSFLYNISSLLLSTVVITNKRRVIRCII